MDKTIDIPPYTVSFRDTGAGTGGTGAAACAPVLLLHGFAEDSTVWDNQVAALGDACRLILPDLPGSGRSPAITTPLPIEAMASVIKGLLDQLQIDRCTLIGHSMGGYIALAFAERYPERLNAFGLFHSTAYPDSDEKKAARRKAIDFIRANGAPPFIRQSTPNLFSAHTHEHHPEWVEAVINKYSGFAPASLIAYYEAMIARPDRTDVLRHATCPVLFISGGDDNIIPLQQTLQQCYLPAISHLHIIGNAGHQAMLENPEMSNQLLLDFITFVSRI